LGDLSGLVDRFFQPGMDSVYAVRALLIPTGKAALS